MTQLYSTIKITLTIATVFLSQYITAQCNISHNENISNNLINDTVFLLGQSFIAECDGNIQFAQFTANEAGTISEGVLNIYNGDTVAAASLIHTQVSPSITIENAGDPIRVDLTEIVNVTENASYTFQISIDNVDIQVDRGNGFPNGITYQDDLPVNNVDCIFSVNIGEGTLSIDDENILNNELSLFPNPTTDFLQISGLTNPEEYTIYNTIGNLVKKGTLHANENIEIRNFTTGIYFLKLDNGNTFKFIKN